MTTGWSRALTGLLALLLTLALLELGLRVFWIKQLVLGQGIHHPHFHHRLKPFETQRFAGPEFDVTTRTNRYGLRGPDPVLPKPPGVVRVLMLGDSFTFGFPVKDEETFCRLIEQGLRAKGYAVEVVNGGVSGYSPTLHYLSLRDEFLGFEPDLVILWYDLGDLQEDHWFQKNLLYGHDGAILRCDPRYTNGRLDWWEAGRRHSALARYVDTKLLRTIHKIRILGLPGYVQAKLRGERSKVAIARLKGRQQAEDLASYDRFLLVRETSTEALVRPYWALSANYLTLIQEVLAERKIPFLLGCYPYGMVVGPDQWAEGRTAWGFERGRTYDPSLALRLLQEFAKQARIPLINTFPRFTEAARTQKLFYDWDGHLTPAGHQVVATALVQDPQFLAVLRRLR